MTNDKQIFVSHSHKDIEIARVIVEKLRSYDCNIWYDEHSMGSSRIQEGIEAGLNSSQVFLLLLSEASLTSFWVRRELDGAFQLEADKGMFIIPAIMRPCIMPLLLSGYQFLDFVNCPDMSVELTRFLRMLEDGPVSVKKGHSEKAAPQKSSVPPKAQRTYSNNNIKGRNVNINQGTQTVNHYGNAAPSNTIPDFAVLAHISQLMRSINTSLDMGQAIDIQLIETFLKLMYILSERKQVLPPKFIEEINITCKRLGIPSLL